MRDRDPVIEAYSASARELAERYETLAGKSPTNLVHRRYRTDVRFRGQRRACRTAETEALCRPAVLPRSEEHTSELQSLMRISYAVFCLKKKQTRVSVYMLHVMKQSGRRYANDDIIQ